MLSAGLDREIAPLLIRCKFPPGAGLSARPSSAGSYQVQKNVARNATSFFSGFVPPVMAVP
jgi:hypothetical protein